MKQAERCQLLFGPYNPPRTRRGKFLFCEWRGTVKVSGYSDALIPWPIKWKTRKSLILCGDLVAAVRQESRLAVAYHWGVSLKKVQDWRRVLEIEPYNAGSQWLMRATARERATPRRMRRLSELARPMSRQPKSEQWKQRMSQIIRRRIARSGAIHPDRPLWTAKEDELLGTDSDQRIGQKLNRTAAAVRTRRTSLGIPLQRRAVPGKWTVAEEKLLGTKSDFEVARLLGRNERGVQIRRQSLGMPAFQQPRQPWTPRDDKLIGTMPDRDLARKLRRPLQAIQARRHLKGIPNPAPLRRMWTEAEDRLLGAMSDEEVAKKLRRPERAVLRRRHAKGIPNPAPRRKFWTPEEMKLLGTRPDKEIAVRLGCPVRTISTKRVKLGIRSFLEQTTNSKTSD